ncbi:MAG TPA: hypothetical protein VEU08_18790 [Vicinamibacterales bacterium]|nr:hypothetical protein [Vicinamibacterales bacterium]
MSDLFPVDRQMMIDEVRREIAQRRNVYARLVSEHKMNGRTATRRIEIMEAVLAKLEAEEPR